jgi:hypothetical protein
MSYFELFPRRIGPNGQYMLGVGLCCHGVFQLFSACCPCCGGNVFNVNNASVTCVDCPSRPQATFSEDHQ